MGKTYRHYADAWPELSPYPDETFTCHFCEDTVYTAVADDSEYPFCSSLCREHFERDILGVSRDNQPEDR